MNVHALRRVIVSLGLMLAIAVGAQAQPVVLPPAPGGGYAVPDVVTPPLNRLRVDHGLIWSSVNAVKYVLQVRVVATGQISKWRIDLSDDCTVSQCIFSFYDDPDARDAFFATVRTGDAVKARVISTFLGGGKSKTEWLSLTVAEVLETTLSTPVDHAWILGGYFTWMMPDMNVKRTLVIVDELTGQRVLRAKQAGGCYDGWCSADPFESIAFTPYRVYNWYIVTKGITGEKIKSDVREFVYGTP